MGITGVHTEMKKLTARFWYYEGPTWLVAVAIYGGWLTLVLNHAVLPWPVIVIAGGILTAWHSSLIHESVHNINTAPKWLKMALVFPPLGVWYPYTYYVRAHTIHHRDNNLTDPDKDPESYYYTRADWERMTPALKSLLMFNQTFAGRIIVGPFVAVFHLAVNLAARLLEGDIRAMKGVGLHVVSLTLLFGFVCGVAGMEWWKYVVCFAYPGLAISLVRSFCEHGAAQDPAHRTAIVESGTFFNLLFLYNNLHVVHHLDPTMPWFKIPEYYRDHRQELHERNGGYVLEGYGEVVRRYLFTPAFAPVHPNS